MTRQNKQALTSLFSQYPFPSFSESPHPVFLSFCVCVKGYLAKTKFGFFISQRSKTWRIALAGSRGPHEMQNGIHVVGVGGRMNVEDGGKRGLTEPFWLCIVVQHGFLLGVSWRSIQQDTTDAKNRQRFRRGSPNVPHHQLPTTLRFVGSPS